MASNYESRIDAVNFSLALDDGLQPQRLDQADLILVGVSRVGKTPPRSTSPCNTDCALPIIAEPDDLAHHSLPDVLLAHLPGCAP